MFFKSSLKYIFNKNNITRNKNYTYSLFDSEIFVFLFHGIGVVFFFNREILTSISPNCRKRNLLYAFKYCDFLLKQCKHNNSTPLIIEKRLDMWTLVSLMPRERKMKQTVKSSGKGSVHLSGKNIALFQMNIQHHLLFFWGFLWTEQSGLCDFSNVFFPY